MKCWNSENYQEYDLEIRRMYPQIVEVGFGTEADAKEGYFVSGIALFKLMHLKDPVFQMRKDLTAKSKERALQTLFNDELYRPVSVPQEELATLYLHMV